MPPTSVCPQLRGQTEGLVFQETSPFFVFWCKSVDNCPFIVEKGAVLWINSTCFSERMCEALLDIAAMLHTRPYTGVLFQAHFYVDMRKTTAIHGFIPNGTGRQNQSPAPQLGGTVDLTANMRDGGQFSTFQQPLLQTTIKNIYLNNHLDNLNV